MTVQLRIFLFFSVLINLVVSACWFFLPHSLYFGSHSITTGQPLQDPFLAHYALLFYGLGVVFALMTFVFIFPRPFWLKFPIGIYSFLTVFLALAQGRALFSNPLEGLQLFLFTVLPLATVLFISFKLRRVTKP